MPSWPPAPRRPERGDDVDPQLDKLGRHCGKAVVDAGSPAILDAHVLAFDVAALLQTLSKRNREQRRGRAGAEDTDDRHHRLLRTRRQRPCRCSTEQA